MTDLLQVFLHDADRQVLSQSFFRASGELIPETKASSGKLPVFFSNLLPEGHMRNYLARLGNVKPTAEFRLIELLGQDLPGAVTVRPIAGDRKLLPESVAVNQVDEKTPYHFFPCRRPAEILGHRRTSWWFDDPRKRSGWGLDHQAAGTELLECPGK